MINRILHSLSFYIKIIKLAEDSFNKGRRAGLVVEPRTPEREVGARSLFNAPCCVLEQDTFTSQKHWYWDVKHKRNEAKSFDKFHLK